MIELMDLIRTYGGAVALIATTIVILLSSKFMTRDSHALEMTKATVRIDELSAKVEKVEDRLTIIEKDIEHLPDTGAFHRMELSLVELKGELSALNERIKPVAEMARRHQDHLMGKL